MARPADAAAGTPPHPTLSRPTRSWVRGYVASAKSALKNRRGRVLDDKADFGDRTRHRLADQIHLAELLDAGGRLIDLLGCQHEAQEVARVDQADQHDIARIGDFVGQEDLAEPRLDLALLGVVDHGIAPGWEDPQKTAVLLAQNFVRNT